MKTLIFGSLNIDKTYFVKSFVLPGQTISARSMESFCGGKGFNQAIALRRSGSEKVFFAGAVGEDGQILIDTLEKNGVDCRFVRKLPCATGHAVIQVDEKGRNCIIVVAGANGEITENDVEKTLMEFDAGDLVVLQNEISCVPQIIRMAHAKGMIVAFNPSPCNEHITSCDISCVDYLLINETEGAAITAAEEPNDILRVLHGLYPQTNVILTLGKNGSIYQDREGHRFPCGIFRTKVIDATAAGDTYTGYFLSSLLKNGKVEEALHRASAAAGFAVAHKGAEPSIPWYQEVERML